MEELIFFGLLIFFSLLDGLIRKRKQGGPVDLPDDWEPADRNDPPPERHAPRPRGQMASYEADHVPSDVWEEIAALARGDAPVRVEPAGGSVEVEQGVPAGSPIRRSEVGVAEVGSRVDLTEHYIHRSHAGYGTDPSSRAPAVLPPGEPGESEDVRAVKKQLAGGRGQLRRAVILQELLGPPVALREPGGPV